ncbi:hypothetical protein ACR03S_12495 [Limimaricola variabilis]
MTPNFALSLSLEGLRLLHRDAEGWTLIGDVPLDSADLAGELAALRARALARAPEGMRTKLLIPEDQIRYLELEGEQDAAAVAQALEGATPYTVDELAIDFVVTQGRTHVAAVARETLDEALAFAREHAMAPVAFAAVPETGNFPGEPFFGGVPGLGAPVARDTVPVRARAVALAEAPEPVPTPEPATEPLPTDPAVGAQADSAPAEAPDQETEPEPEPELTEAPVAAPAEPAPQPEAGLSGVQEDIPATQPDDDGMPAEQSSAYETEADRVPEPLEAEPLSELEPEPVPVPQPLSEPEPGEDEDDALLASPSPAAPPRTASPAGDQPRPAAPPASPPLPPRGEAVPAVPPADREAAEAAKRIMPPAMPRPGAPPAAMPAVPPAETSARKEPETPNGAEAQALAAGAALKTATPAAAATAPNRGSDRASERERMTVFGARRSEPETRPGRGALMAGLAALLILVLLVGLWLRGSGEAPQAGLLRDSSPAVEIEPAAAAAPEAADTQEVEASAVPEPVELPNYDDYPEPEPVSAAAISPAEAERIYAATGVWLRAPRLPLTPRSETLEAPVPALADQALTGDMPMIRLAAASPDAGLPAQSVPPPAGSVFDRDARGFIAATVEGTVLPQGLTVFSGRPEILPPNRPGTVAPEQPDEAETEAEPETGTDEQSDEQLTILVPEVTPESRPEDLAPNAGPPPVVPPNRPGTLVPEAEADAEEDGEAAQAEVSPGGVALDALRPTRRPEDLEPEPLAAYEGPRPPLRPEGLAPDAQAQVDEAADAQAEALAEAVSSTPDAPPARASVADALASLMADAPDPLANATAQAVPTARRPDSRPRNFDRVVAQSRARVAAPAPAATEPEEVASATVAPDGPVPGGVARAATIDDAINLRDINLIGVYGRPGARRALVRMANGRYLRVGIGDSLDGGRVTAIGDDVLNYVKRGRTLVLQIPD